jgi:hypothetical protein
MIHPNKGHGYCQGIRGKNLLFFLDSSHVKWYNNLRCKKHRFVTKSNEFSAEKIIKTFENNLLKSY